MKIDKCIFTNSNLINNYNHFKSNIITIINDINYIVQNELYNYKKFNAYKI